MFLSIQDSMTNFNVLSNRQNLGEVKYHENKISVINISSIEHFDSGHKQVLKSD